MKKLLLFIIVLFLFIPKIYSCDETFTWALRYWHDYIFHDTFFNDTQNSVWISNVDFEYVEQYDFNWSDFFPDFQATSQITEQWGIIWAWDSQRIVESESLYQVNYYPPVRAQDNLFISYDVEYYIQDWNTWDGPFMHKECKYYEVTRCWDGIIESDYETCDPLDTTETAWWNLGCSATCEPINDTNNTPSCTSLTASPASWVSPFLSTLTCTWLNATTFTIDIEKDGLTDSIDSSTWTYNFTELGTYNVTCFIDDTITSSACRQTITVTEWGWPNPRPWPWPSPSNSWNRNTYCWDGMVSRLNDDHQYEECDGDEPWCVDCKITNNTTPNIWWDLDIWPTGTYIIWAGMNPYEEYTDMKPSITNKSSTSIYFDRLCVYKWNWSSLAVLENKVPKNKVCEDYKNVLWKGKSFKFTNIPDIKWKMPLDDVTNFEDNTLITSIEIWNETYKGAFFAEKLTVRVSKPSIATTWWWTSYLKNTWNIADISAVSNSQENKNFVWAWVSKKGISSYSKEVTEEDSVKVIGEEWESYNKNIVIGSNLDFPWNTNYYHINKFESYNWIANAYVLRGANFTLRSDTLSDEEWARTYIIEKWNLIIENNINYPDNIAFVVKWWNISISNDVTNINGIFIAIPNINTWWWDIKSTENNDTTNILTINGSLYWNIDNLVKHRTYIKQDSTTWQLNVWTIVSFWSSVFRDPAPLTSTFISRYLDATKIAE